MWVQDDLCRGGSSSSDEAEFTADEESDEAEFTDDEDPESDSGSEPGDLEDDPEALEMENFVESDGVGRIWGKKTYQPPEELQHLQTEEEVENIQKSGETCCYPDTAGC